MRFAICGKIKPLPLRICIFTLSTSKYVNEEDEEFLSRKIKQMLFSSVLATDPKYVRILSLQPNQPLELNINNKSVTFHFER